MKTSTNSSANSSANSSKKLEPSHSFNARWVLEVTMDSGRTYKSLPLSPLELTSYSDAIQNIDGISYFSIYTSKTDIVYICPSKIESIRKIQVV